MFRGTMFLLVLCCAFAAQAQRPAALMPTDPDTVIERLPKGYSLASNIPAADASPSASTLQQARGLLAAAAQTGDARLASRAEAVLSRFPADDTRADVLRMRAFAAQHRHDFAEARRLLDRWITRDPRAGDARLARAQIHVIGGRLDAARADCAALVLGVDAGDGMLCVAMLSMRQGQYPAAASVVGRWLAQNPDGDRDGRRYALTMRAEIAARAGERDAERYFRDALALAPDDVRTLAAYARFLRGAGRAREVDALLRGHPGHEGLLLQRALALRETDPAAADAIAAKLARGYAAAHRLGRAPELRDEAELLLTLRLDPQGALALAQFPRSARRGGC
jgi:tetratricopeptide (TPR) repeat protein